MKNFMLTLCIVSGAILSGYSQEATYGLKAGASYAMGGQVTGKSSGGLYTDDTFNASPGIGFHGGVFLQLDFKGFFLRPEVVYHDLKTEFDFPFKASTYAVSKINVPLLLGINVQENFGVYLGPVYSHILSATIEGKEFTENEPVQIYGDDVVAQTSPINVQIGAEYEFGRWGLDLRYEHNLSSAEPEPVDMNHSAPGWYGINRATIDDARLSQLILSLTYKFNGSGMNTNRKKRRPGSYRW